MRSETCSLVPSLTNSGYRGKVGQVGFQGSGARRGLFPGDFGQERA